MPAIYVITIYVVDSIGDYVTLLIRYHTRGDGVPTLMPPLFGDDDLPAITVVCYPAYCCSLLIPLIYTLICARLIHSYDYDSRPTLVLIPTLPVDDLPTLISCCILFTPTHLHHAPRDTFTYTMHLHHHYCPTTFVLCIPVVFVPTGTRPCRYPTVPTFTHDFTFTPYDIPTHTLLPPTRYLACIHLIPIYLLYLQMIIDRF